MYPAKEVSSNSIRNWFIHATKANATPATRVSSDLNSVLVTEPMTSRTVELEWLDEATLDIVRGSAFLHDVDWFLRKRLRMSDTMIRMANDELLKKHAAQFCARHLEKYFRGIRATGIPSGRLIFGEVLWRYRNLRNELLNKSRLKSPFNKYRKVEPVHSLQEVQRPPTPDSDEPLEVLEDTQADPMTPPPEATQQNLLLVPRTPEAEQSRETVPTNQLSSTSNEVLENPLQTVAPKRRRPRRRPRRPRIQEDLNIKQDENPDTEACLPSHSLNAEDDKELVIEAHQPTSLALSKPLDSALYHRQKDREPIVTVPEDSTANHTASHMELVTELAERAEHSETLQAENQRLKEDLRMASDHRRFVESTLRLCRDTYLAEGDSARNIGISSLAAKCYAVVTAVEHIQLDTEFVYFKNHLARQSSTPVANGWLEGPRNLRQRYEVLRS